MKGPGIDAAQVRQATAGALNPNTANAWNYFVHNTSLTSVQVAGFEGNLMEESGLDPAKAQNNCNPKSQSCGIGIAQWTVGQAHWAALSSLAVQEAA